MFPTPSKVSRSALSRLWLLPAIALAMLLLVWGAIAYSSAAAQNIIPGGGGTLPGDFCIEGIVINWEEKPLAGWQITLTTDLSPTLVLTTVSAPEPDEDDDEAELEKGEFVFNEDNGLPQAPGTYTVTIESRPGWEGVTPTSITFNIEVGEEDCIQIRFKMRRIVPVTVIKFDANHVGLEDWKILAAPGPGNLFAEPEKETTNISGVANFTLTPGVWIFTEHPPKQDKDGDDPREAYMPIVPPTGRQELHIDDDLPLTATLTVVFKNELVVGCIAIQKIGVIGDPPDLNGTEPVTPNAELTVPVVISPNQPLTADVNTNVVQYFGQYGVPGWGFKLLRKDGSIARQGVTDATGRLEFDNLPLGPYIIVEENRAGWNEITERKLEVNVTGNHCDLFPDPEDTTEPIDLIDPTIVFENEQDDSGFCIEGRKIDANGGYGIAGWEIEIEPVAEGGFDPGDTVTDGLGEFRFDFPRNDYRIPGAEYEICEADVDGWLPHTDTCQTVRLPEWPMGKCVQLRDFINQQVGHSESQKYNGQYGGPEDNGNGQYGNDNGPYGGPQYGNKGQQCRTYHIVKEGEGLFSIGNDYKVSPQAMIDANPDVRSDKNWYVYVGQRICIP
ncbi:MAG TPA: SpaA isopeptide-forming pilin-related protein [Caldilineaceae bacterium]|nr:SpaA isopeptide-forming pilin-related protein [Caldilineaceae bacterium]